VEDRADRERQAAERTTREAEEAARVEQYQRALDLIQQGARDEARDALRDLWEGK
jgi:DNA-binding FadR family transcriptional regulator